MIRIYAIAKKEFFHILRDKRLAAAIFIMPIIQLVLFASALSFDVKHIPTAILDLNHTAQSRQLIQSYQHNEFFNVVKSLNNRSEVDQSINSSEVKTVIIIPPDFNDKLFAGKKTSIQVLVDGSEPNTAQIASSYSAAITQFFSSQFSRDYLAKRGLVTQNQSAITLQQRVWYNPEQKSTNFFIPGLIALIMMGLTINQTAVAIVKEKETGTIEQIRVSPIKEYQLMIGKIIPYTLIAFLDVTVISLAAIFVYNVPFRGDLIVMAIGSVLFVFGTLGIGLIISSISSTLETANQLGALMSMLPGFMLSGFMFPINSMPKALQYLTFVIPARYYVSILRGVFLKGAGFQNLWLELTALAVFCTFTIIIASVSMRRRTY
jgi:ABC-2 type transport system permease protein